MTDFRDDRVVSALRGENPTVLARLATSFAVMGDVQFLPGYCIALVDRPGIEVLTDLPRKDRLTYLSDVDLLAEAVTNVCRSRDSAFRRVNIEILGNTYAALHIHIWPRYDWEPAARLAMPVWLYSRDHWSASKWRLSPDHDGWRRDLAREIARLGS
ncbi:diadenosine tetraphosphate hydrolase [Acidipropionibacterium virtanenii]|uniref:HIT domain-containing protein n=1 Tax=Acidipropionibacterium virtanenii TaxID=2057246 RepID=A0A344USW3_9ACTN|nr:diadenosine tetraphosphate hydrolase [Acidipropionibacterium virtanenii]AXE38361.1 hypothetical protein JS278_01183 [Acidipropionibacterium virtanenii]